MGKLLVPLHNQVDFNLLSQIEDIMLELVILRDEEALYSELQSIAGAKSRKVIEMVSEHLRSKR
jgi:hypothetical protein